MKLNGESSNLSLEQVQQFNKTLSAIKDLPAQQEEIIKRVLQGETEIGELRLSFLEQHFDTYSKKLDEIVARKKSDLNDIFLILDSKLSSSYKKLSSDIDKIKEQLEDISTESADTQQKPQKDSSSTNVKALADTVLSTLADAYKKENEARAKILGSGNNELLALEKQYQEQRYAQLKQHLDNIVNIASDAQNKQIAELGISREQESEAGYAPERLNTAAQYANLVTESIFKEISLLSEEARATRSEWKAAGQQESQNENLQKLISGSEQAASGASDVAHTDSIGEDIDYSQPYNKPEGISAGDADTGVHVDIPEADSNLDNAVNLFSNIIEFINSLSKSGINNLDLDEMPSEQKKLFENQLKKIYEDLAKARKDSEDELTKTQERINALRERAAELELARSEEELDAKTRSSKLQLDLLENVLEAEIRAQTLANQIDLQLSLKDKDASDFSDTRARGINAKRDIEAAEILQKQMDDFRASLDAEAAAKNSGVLTAEAALDNDNAVRERFADYENILAGIKAEKAIAAEDPRAVEANEARKAALIAKLELQAKKENHGVLDALEKQKIKERADREFELSDKNLKRLHKEELKNEKEKQKAEKISHRKATDSIVGASLLHENNLVQHIKDLKKVSDEKTAHGSDGEKLVAALDTAVTAVSGLLTKLDNTIDSIASYKGDIDTRLQGSKNEQSSGSYWSQLTKDMMSVGAVTPYFKQEDFAKNIKSLVDQGISFDLKQRAFLMTIQEKIAGTFNSFDGTMLRLIRIQQEDSTAGRLGMESALNSFLNEMYENTEYLKTVAEGVRSSLQEMESLMSGAEATEVEYQVQKWMGSLYSVGMSQEAVNNIAGALGQIAAGQVDALTNGSGAGNLLVMAANQAGKSISEILTGGLNADETNALLQSAVNYLAGLAKSSEDSRVVQQQLASVYGVKASDLRAAVTLASDVSTDVIAKEALTYDNMIGRLNEMAGTMHLRTSLGEMMQNVWANGQYTLAGSMANNPAAYLLYKTASLLDATTGGINLPAVSVAGFGVDLETTVADLMRVGAISTGVLGSFGSMISGLSNSFSGRAMLSEMGIKEGSGLAVNIRGSGEGISASDINGGGAQTLSGSGYVGNASGSDIKDSTMQEAEDSKDKLMIEAIEEEQAHQIDYINENVLKIYELLDEVTNGKRNFNVKVSGYGLTSTVSSSALIGAQGGVGGQLNVSNGMNSGSGAIGNGGFSSGYGSSGGFSGGSGSSGSGGGVASGGSVGGSASGSASADGGGYNLSRGIDLGGWTMM